MIDFNCYPYQILGTECEIWHGTSNMKFNFAIPVLINKFMQFKFIDMVNFKKRFKNNEMKVLRNEPLILNSKIIKSAYDFKKYFPSLIDLNPHKEYDAISGISDLKIGGIFELFPHLPDFLMRIIYKPNKKAIFQIACEKEIQQDFAQYILNTLIFLFKQ